MRIDATALATDGLRYASPAAGGAENEAVLGRSGGVTGFYETSPSGHVVDARAAELDVRRAVWRVGAGRVAVDSPARLAQVTLRLDIPAGDAATRVRVGVESAHLPQIRYESGDVQLAATAELEGALIERDASGKLSVVAVAASLGDVSLKVGALELRVGQLRARRFVLVSDASTRIAAESAELHDVRIVTGDVTLHAARIDVPRGLAWQDGRIDIAELAIAALDLACELSPAAESAAPASAAPPRRLPDVAALDQLDGHVSADIAIHATLPILKERGMSHALRVPIDRGAISFGELEAGFSAVADALLDFEVEDDVLKLELDVIPIVKFDNVTLVSWKLVDAVDRELAGRKSIRLRRLLQFERPPSKTDEHAKRGDESSVRLLGLDIAPITVRLSARAPVVLPLAGGAIVLDDGEGHAVEAFELGGELHVVMSGEPKQGRLRASAKGIVATLEKLAFGSARIDSAVVAVPSVESIHVTFAGTAPTRLTSAIPAIRVERVGLVIGSGTR